VIRAAIDVGGTFTDLVATDEDTGRLYFLKLPSTPSEPEAGLSESIRSLIAEGVNPRKISCLVHATTMGTNLLLGQMGLRVPKCALVTTHGFRDVVEIGRQNRPELYNIHFRRPKPLVERSLRFEVRERVDFRGRVLSSPARGELQKLARSVKESGAETAAVCFLNSFANGMNEKLARAALEKAGLPVHISCEVDPQQREYERTSTTVVSAILAPVVSEYLARANAVIRKLGIPCEMQILSSSGGVIDQSEAASRPILCLESGPAAGVIGAAKVARALSVDRAISFDMGGTTAKAGVVMDFEPLTVPEMEVGGKVHMGRAIRGSGYPVRSVSIDLAEVSAGGGTIIWADKTGVLGVGPISAGAEPGPVCYGRGGKEPTITDADLHLGRLGSMVGGRLTLDRAGTESALSSLGKKVAMSPDEVAASAIRLVVAQMSRAVNIVSLERGLDPRDFALIAFGGAGPMHAAELAEVVGIERVIIPPHPGLFSAIGMLATDAKYTSVRGFVAAVDGINEGGFETAFAETEAELRSRLDGRGLVGGGRVRRWADSRYLGQGYEIAVPVGGRFRSAELRKRFEEKHTQVYGFRHEGTPIEVTAIRVEISFPAASPRFLSYEEKGEKTKPANRKAMLSARWTEVPVYRRGALAESVSGPAIVEEYDSTTVVPPGWTCERTEEGCLRLEAS
jgi:N-methylhydantoinase A